MDTQKNRIVTCRKYAVAELWDTILMAISLFIIIWLLLLNGCSSSSKSVKPGPTPPPAVAEIESHRLEQINRGIALFEGGHFEEAADCFEMAASLTGGKEPLFRQCLMAAAVSRLVVNDREGFTDNIVKIKSRYERSDFLLLIDKDEKLKHIIELHEIMQKGREK